MGFELVLAMLREVKSIFLGSAFQLGILLTAYRTLRHSPAASAPQIH